MADNTTLNTGTGGDVIRTEDKGGIKVPVSLIDIGGTGAESLWTGTVTADAGTNLNTSALAIETGGNLAGAATSLAILDDWDESDRAKVNPIAGQAGVQGASGAVTALTQRVCLATDVALPAGTNLLGRVNLDPQTGNGLSFFRSLDLDESEEEVKASAGAIYGAWVTNTATTTRWLKFYNATAANVEVGTTAAALTLGIPGNTTDDISGILSAGGHGIAFGTAITVAATTGAADNDTGAPAAGDVVLNLFYK